MKATVAELARLPGVWRGGELEHAPQATVPTGHAALDRELPGAGWPSGTLTEVLHDDSGIGEVGFLLGALARACTQERLLAWVNPPYLPYAPALAQAGILLERCLVLRPASRADAFWAAEQALRSGACGAALLWLASAVPGESRTRAADDYAWLRRLQMAAEAGRSMAVLYRPASAEAISTPAHLRVVAAQGPGGLALRIPKRRGPPLTLAITLEAGWRPHPSRSQPSRRPEEAPAPRPSAVPASVPARAVPRIVA